MFRALIWGIVSLCRSNITRDMIKILKSCFFKTQFFTFNFSKKCKNWHFLKKQFFRFLIISPVIFDLQKRTIPQIKALNILFWPYFIHFIDRMGIWWAMKPRKCPVFCSSDFIKLLKLTDVQKAFEGIFGEIVGRNSWSHNLQLFQLFTAFGLHSSCKNLHCVSLGGEQQA